MTELDLAALKVRELAARWHVHPNTVRRLARKGEIPFFRVGTRGDHRFRVTDVEAYEAREWKP